MPFDYVLVHVEHVTDWPTVERALHVRFAEHRVTQNREFFRVTARIAIAAAIEEATPYLWVETPITEPLAAAAETTIIDSTGAKPSTASTLGEPRRWIAGARGIQSFTPFR